MTKFSTNYESNRAQMTSTPIPLVIGVMGVVGVLIYSEVTENIQSIENAEIACTEPATCTHGFEMLQDPHELVGVVGVVLALAIGLTLLGRAQRYYQGLPYSWRDVGMHWGVDIKERGPYHSEREPCVICGQNDLGETRTFRRDTVAFGLPIKRHRLGANHYCEECADPGSERRNQVESWPTGYDRPTEPQGIEQRIAGALRTLKSKLLPWGVTIGTAAATVFVVLKVFEKIASGISKSELQRASGQVVTNTGADALIGLVGVSSIVLIGILILSVMTRGPRP